MTIKKLFCLIVTLLFIIGCDKEEANDSNLSSTILITYDSPEFFARTVILFEDSNYLIKTNFDTYITSYPFGVLYGYDEFKMLATKDSYNKDVILMTDYLRYSGDGVFTLAYHLQRGSCLIYDKRNNKIVLTVEIEEWVYSPAPLAGCGGRRFFIEGELFLETTDWIS